MPSIRVEDIELSYSESGSGDPVVLLHGQGGDGASWWAQTAALSPAFRIVAVDLRGHGASTVTPGPVPMERFSRDVVALCGQLGLRRFHVLGHSLGAMVALRLALDAPEAVRSLAVINGSAWGHPSKLRTAVIAGVIRLAGMRTFARLNARQHLPGPSNAAHRQRLIDTMGACPADGYLSAQAAVDAFDVRDDLSQISCPTLVVHSEQDVIPRAEKEFIASSVRRGRLVTLPDSRHVPLWDAPDALNAVLRAFLASA